MEAKRRVCCCADRRKQCLGLEQWCEDREENVLGAESTGPADRLDVRNKGKMGAHNDSYDKNEKQHI